MRLLSDVKFFCKWTSREGASSVRGTTVTYRSSGFGVNLLRVPLEKPTEEPFNVLDVFLRMSVRIILGSYFCPT